MSHHLCIVNQHYPPDTLASGQIIAELAEDLVNNHGWRVTVLAGAPLRRAEGDSAPLRQWQNGVRVVRVPSYNPNRRGLVKRLAHYASYIGLAWLKSAKIERPDIVLTMSTPPLLTLWMGLALSRKWEIPLVYNVQDLFPDILENKVPQYLYNLLSRVVRVSERRADRIVTISEQMKTRLTHNGLASEKIDVVRNWADTEHIVPKSTSDYRALWDLDGKTVVAYSGNVGRMQGLEFVIQAAEKTIEHTEIVWLIIGDGDSKMPLQREVQEKKLTNVQFHPYQPKHALGELFASFDIALVPLRAQACSYLMPCKVYGVMAASAAIIAATEEESELGQYLAENGAGVIVEPENAEALASAVLTLASSPERMQDLGANARALVQKTGARNACTDMWQASLQYVVTPDSRELAVR